MKGWTNVSWLKDVDRTDELQLIMARMDRKELPERESMKDFTINDTDREDFVRNDEGLYTWWKGEMRGEKKLRQFVRSHRNEIDSAIRRASRPNREPEDEPFYMIGRGAFGPMASPAPTNRYDQSMVGRAGQSLLPR